MPSADFSKRACNYEASAHIQKKYASSLVNDSMAYIKSSTPKVADLGCGTGSVCGEILNSSPTAIIENYDISEEMLRISKRKFSESGISFHCQSLPAGTEYDMIISNFALQWYDKLPETLGLCLNKLKGGGILSVCVPVCGSFETLRSCFEKAEAGDLFFNFPKIPHILDSITESEVIIKEFTEEELTYNSTLDFFKNIHQIGANQSGTNLSRTKLRKLIQYHDELFDGKIIVKYKILKLIIKRVI